MLRLGGAYRLTDAGLGPLLRRAPALEALALPQCSRLDGAFLAALPAGLRCAGPQGLASLCSPRSWQCPRLHSPEAPVSLSGSQDMPHSETPGRCRSARAGFMNPELHALWIIHPGLSTAECSSLAWDLLCGSGLGSMCLPLTLSTWHALLCRSLDLAECRGVGMDALLGALEAAPNLAELALDGNPEVDDGALGALAAACPRLRRLSVANCGGVGEAGLAAAARGLPALVGLVADDCGRAGDGALLALAEACPRLEVRNYGPP